MEKSIISKDYRLFLDFLKKIRQDVGITQVQIAKKLKVTQSQISKVERGERRIDIIEVRRWARALGLSLPEFAVQMEAYFKSTKTKD
jgi:transcriptional regulator with XRE-family HTH domain